jgi:hypothetical protein
LQDGNVSISEHFACPNPSEISRFAWGPSSHFPVIVFLFK